MCLFGMGRNLLQRINTLPDRRGASVQQRPAEMAVKCRCNLLDVAIKRIYTLLMIICDEAKRQINLVKHGYDLADAAMVYDSPNKITLESERNGEKRNMDIALVAVADVVLALVYVERDGDVRAISLRRASTAERKLYADEIEN